MDEKPTTLGHHYIIEYYGCNQEILNNVDKIEKAMLTAAEKSRASILGHRFHTFEPQGVTGVVVLSESHITIHTWPEYGYAAVDMFFCFQDGNVDKIDPVAAVASMTFALEASEMSEQRLERG